MITAGSSAHLSLLFLEALSCPTQAAIPLIPLFSFPEPPLTLNTQQSINPVPHPFTHQDTNTKRPPNLHAQLTSLMMPSTPPMNRRRNHAIR